MVGSNPEDFRDYLVGIGMGAAQIEQAEIGLATVRGLLPEEPEYLFVSEYRDAEGNRNYESLWVFTARFISEGEPFASEGKFDIIRRDTGLDQVLIEHAEFDFQTPVDASRLRLDLSFKRFGARLSGTVRASGSNCGDLNQVLREYVLATLFEG